MKKIAIMQPTYLPWSGYIALAMSVDQFVYLDSVQFSRRSWQQRNRIKTSNGETLLTVPVVKGPREQNICDVEIFKNGDFPLKHIETLLHAYSKSRYFSDYSEMLFSILNEGHKSLAELNIRISNWIFETLDVKVKTLRSSSLNLSGNKDELLSNICTSLDAEHYVSPIGSSSYLDNSSYFGEEGIKFSYMNYSPTEYKQLYGDFIPSLSVIDLLFNEGKHSLEIIKKGLKHE